MKAQRRHELQQNVLDAELAKGVDFLRRRRTAIVWGVVLVVAAVLLLAYGVSSARNRHRAVQAKYDRLTMSPAVTGQEFLDGMKSLAEADDKAIAALATVQVGKFYAAQFAQAGGVVADPQQKDLADQAAAYYRRAIDSFPGQRLAAGEAHLGLARLAEGQGDFATAVKEYQSIAGMADLMGTPTALAARDGLSRIDRIKTPVRMATTTSAPAGARPVARPPTTAPAEAPPAPSE